MDPVLFSILVAVVFVNLYLLIWFYNSINAIVKSVEKTKELMSKLNQQAAEQNRILSAIAGTTTTADELRIKR
jgi:hypothetical protein